VAVLEQRSLPTQTSKVMYSPAAVHRTTSDLHRSPMPSERIGTPALAAGISTSDILHGPQVPKITMP
jgi:hypothetical protein